MKRIADLIVDRPWAVAAGLVIFSALALLGAGGLTIDDVPRSFFRSDDPEFERLEQTFRDFASDDNECLVLLEADEVFAPEVVARITELDRELSLIEGVREVLSLDDVLVFDAGLRPGRLLPDANAPRETFDRAREIALTHPLVEDQLLSLDGKATLLVVRLTSEIQSVSSIRPVVDAIEDTLTRLHDPGAPARLTGIPPIRAVIFESIAREQTLFSIIGAVLGFAIGWRVFRRLGPILITSCASLLASLWALGCFSLTGQSINILNSALPLLIMVIALTDAMHLMIHILRSRHEGLSIRDAARDALRELGIPCALTSLTTAVGFGSLAISRVGVIRDFGILFALAVGISFVVVLTTVPALSVLFLRAGSRRGFDSTPGRLRRLSEGLIDTVVRHARGVSLTGALVTAALLVVALRLSPDNRLTEATPRNAESVEVLDACENAFGGVLTASVLCEWPEAGVTDARRFESVRAVQRALDELPFFHGSLSVLDLMEALPGPPQVSDTVRARSLTLLPDDLVRRTWRPDLGRALVSARVPDRPSAEAAAAYDRLDAALNVVSEDFPEVELHLTGTDVVARRNVNVMIADFALGLGLAAAVIFAVLSVAFGSLRLGAISVLPNVFPLVLAASLLAISGLELQMTSVIAFTVCLGLAVDDTIHFVARFQRELRACGDPERAAVRAYLEVGRALLVTTAILMGAFLALGFSEIPTTQLFARICCVGLAAALVGDLVFLPALLVTFTRPARPEEPVQRPTKAGSSVSSSLL